MTKKNHNGVAKLLVASAVVGFAMFSSVAFAGPGDGGESGHQLARGNLRFVEGYQKGYEKAMREGKPMLLFFTADWCQNCHQMADEVFTRPQIVSLSERFVCILIDADAEPEVCEQFQIKGCPTIQFASPRGALMERILGKKPAGQILKSMQAALKNAGRR